MPLPILIDLRRSGWTSWSSPETPEEASGSSAGNVSARDAPTRIVVSGKSPTIPPTADR